MRLPASAQKREDLFSMSLLNRKERGQGLVEYGLILVLASIVVIIVLAVLGPQIGNIFSQITTELTF